MYLGPAQSPILFGVDDVIDDVIGSKKPSKLEIALSLPFFELQQNLKN